MSIWASLSIAVSAAIFLILGSLHACLSFYSEKFSPRDDALKQRMQEIAPKISKQTTMWRAGIGFHVSHSLGAILFGLMYLYFSLVVPEFLYASWFLRLLGLLYILSMWFLAKCYWFEIPMVGIAVAAILYGLGMALTIYS